MPFNKDLTYADLDLANSAKGTQNIQKLDRIIKDFQETSDNVSERLEDFLNILRTLNDAKIKPNIQQKIGQYLMLLVLSSQTKELPLQEVDIHTLRIILQKIADIEVIAELSNLNIKFNEPINTMYIAAQMQASILERPQDIDVRPTRIIAFYPKDFSNKEIKESIKIAFLKHTAKGETCLISCTEKEILAFGNACKTLVLIGHGRFCREGDRTGVRSRLFSASEARQARLTDPVYIGASSGNVEKVAQEISGLLGKLPHITHCRLTICMAGSVSKKFREESVEVFYKEVPDSAPGRQSASVVFDGNLDHLVFDEESLAGRIWTNLFLSSKPIFNLEKDFALTASSEVINPIPSTEKASHGHFEGTLATDEPHYQRWNKGEYVAKAVQFWKPEQPKLTQTKSITLATPSSSKHQKRVAGSMSDGIYHAPSYKRNT